MWDFRVEHKNPDERDEGPFASFLSVRLASPTMSVSRATDAQWTAAAQIAILILRDAGRARLPGERQVAQRLVQNGDLVREGQPFLVFDAIDLQLEVPAATTSPP